MRVSIIGCIPKQETVCSLKCIAIFAKPHCSLLCYFYENIHAQKKIKTEAFREHIKCLECSETKEYAKIFCYIFARVSDKNFFRIFFYNIVLQNQSFISFKIIHFRFFLFQKRIYLYIYLRMQDFFYMLLYVHSRHTRKALRCIFYLFTYFTFLPILQFLIMITNIYR